MMRRFLAALSLVAALLLPPACTQPRAAYRDLPPDPAVLHDAVGELTRVIVHDILSPPHASRTYAYASIAAYEALGAGPSLAGRVNGLAPVPKPAAGEEHYLPLSSVYAFLTVGRALVFSQERVDEVRERALARFREMGVPREVLARSVEHGERVAAHVLAWAREDHFAETRGHEKYTVTDEPGRWVPTAPAYLSAVEPNWGKIRPFALDSASQFRPRPPLPYDMTPGSPFREQVTRVLEARRRMSPDEQAIAAFWDCNPYVMNLRGHVMVATKKITPGGHWMGIVGIAARRSGADLARSAEAYAKVSIALADGFISSWEEKYRSNVVRPETVIQEHLDPEWTPLLQTPPFPEYTSGHSVISTAAAEVLTDLFGENFAFADSTEVEYGLPVRTFTSFRAAAAEAAQSRLFGGIHYPMSIEEGVQQGERVGKQVLARVQPGRAPVMASRDAAR